MSSNHSNPEKHSLAQLILDRVLQRYYLEGYSKTMRLGQFYVNHYTRGTERPWPSLFYEESLAKSIDIIAQHLWDVCGDDDEEE